MNIQINELSLLDRKMMKLRNSNPDGNTTSPVTEEPKEAEMSYLQSKANNNIAFQRSSATISTATRHLKMASLAILMAAATVACKEDKIEMPDVNITESDSIVVENTNNIDFTALLEFFNALIADNKAEATDRAKMIELLTMLYEAQVAGNKQDAQYQATVIEYLIKNETTQQALLDQSVKNGQTLAEFNLKLDKITKMFEDGKFAEVLAEISATLNGINTKLDVLVQVQATLNQIAENTKDIMSKEQADRLIAGIDQIYESQEAQRADTQIFQGMVVRYLIDDAFMNRLMLNQLVKNGKKQDQATAELEGMRADGAEAYNKVIELLKSIDSKLGVITEWTTILNQLVENTTDLMTKEEAEKIIATLTDIYNSQEAKNADDKEFQKMVVKSLISNNTLNRLIYNQLIKNGYTAKEANEKLEEANITLDEIKDILTDIRVTVKEIFAEVKKISENIVSNHKDWLKARKEDIEMMKLAFEYEEKQTQLLSNMNKTTSEMNAKIDSLRSDILGLKDIISDPSKFNELMDKIDNLEIGSIDYNRFEEMFKLLNKNMHEIALASKNDRETLRKDLLGAINNFENTVKTIAEEHSAKYTEISNKISLLLTAFPNYDFEGVKDALADLENAVKENTTVSKDNTANIGNKLDGVNGRLDQVLAKLDTLIKEFGKLADVYGDLIAEWNADVKSLIEAMKAGHTDIVEEIKSLENSQNIANSLIEAGTAGLIEAINNIKVSGGNGEGMTIAQLKAYMQERDAENFKKLEALLDGLGIDDLSKDVDTIKDRFNDLPNYFSQLNEILTAVKNLDKNDPNYEAKFNKIIEILENWECNCDCGKDSSFNEGILGDLQNALAKAETEILYKKGMMSAPDYDMAMSYLG